MKTCVLEELDATICAREKELKELKAQQKQNRPVLVDETKPRSVSANGDYKPTTHFKVINYLIILYTLNKIHFSIKKLLL